MYHPHVIAQTAARFEREFGVSLVEHSVEEVIEWTAHLDLIWDAKAEQPLRPLSADEQGFVQNELLLTKSSFTYWAERYAFINSKGTTLMRLFPLWESQTLILDEIGRLQLASLSGAHHDGLLIALLKARQLGGSTLAQTLIAHRVTTQDNQLGLIAADVPEQSAFLFDMLERIYLNLPWWLRPNVVEWTKNNEIKFDGGSNVWVGSGKSTRGQTGDRGQLGRGRTVGTMHLSELSTWEDTQQLDASLFPTMHPSPRLLAILESTGRGRGNYWHKLWKQAREGGSRFTPVFIPWYAEKTRYSTPAPVGWSPKLSTTAHAKKAEEVGPRWLRRPVSLTRDQLFWYERTRAEAKALGTEQERAFLENYCADDEEAFQFSGRSVVPFEVLTRIEDQMRGLKACFEIGRRADIERARATHAEDLDLRVPAGYSLLRVPKPDRGDDLTAFHDKLLVWQLPVRGRYYVVSVDVGDGLGLDRSAIEVTAVGTVEQPDEQVAQFVSSKVDPVELAPFIEVIGQLYAGPDDQPAVAAIEINGHGLATQSELQKHLGYPNLYVWRVEDSADPGKSLTTRIGWVTTSRSRPILLSRYFKKLKSWDPNTGLPDYIVNSPLTLSELRDFIIPPGSLLLADAQADPSNPSAHDDTILAGAIGLYVAQTMQEDLGETTDDRRRRKAEEAARRLDAQARAGVKVSARNTDWTLDELATEGQEE